MTMNLKRDLARGRALALHIMDGLDEELALAEALAGMPLTRAAGLRDKWRARPEPGDLFMWAQTVELFTAELSLARAEHYGASFRPCPFDPYHESAGTRVLWRPQESAPRPVVCCAADAALIGEGKSPGARMVSTLKGRMPLWDGDDIDARWLLGHHAATGTDHLGSVFRGTFLGHWINSIPTRGADAGR
jgi:hypothetical protein